jgi:hypothetical protein
VSRKTRVRKKRSALIRAGLAKRLVPLEREIHPIERSLALLAERAEARPLVAPLSDEQIPTFEAAEAEVVIVQLTAPVRKRRWSTREERQQTLASRLQKSHVAASSAAPAGAPTYVPFDDDAEEASVVIIVQERGPALPPPLPDRNRDI